MSGFVEEPFGGGEFHSTHDADNVHGFDQGGKEHLDRGRDTDEAEGSERSEVEENNENPNHEGKSPERDEEKNREVKLGGNEGGRELLCRNAIKPSQRRGDGEAAEKWKVV